MFSPKVFLFLEKVVRH